MWRELEWLVDDSVGNGDAERGAARLDLIFPSLEQYLIVALEALLLLLLRRHKPQRHRQRASLSNRP